MDIRKLLPINQSDVTIRALSYADATAYATGTEDAAVRRFAHLPEPHYTPSLVTQQIDSIITPSLIDGTLAVLAIADSISEAFLGSVVLFDITPDRAEVGFWLAPEARGRAAAQQAMACAVELGARLELHELYARTVYDNAASVRTLTAAGFTPHGDVELGTAPSGEEALMQHYIRTL